MSLSRKTDSYEVTAVAGERVRAFVPAPLPPARPALDETLFARELPEAELAIKRLNDVADLTPSIDCLIYASVRKEALLASQIEAAQASLTHLFEVESARDVGNTADVEEVTNYLKAVRLVRKNLTSLKGLPISKRLLCEAHKVLMSGARGRNKQPGHVRTSQNWIGGRRAPAMPCMCRLLRSMCPRSSASWSATSIRLRACMNCYALGCVHVQFETIHPFLDGDGRIGRLLITALLEDWHVIDEPLMYPSGFFKQHQAEYFKRRETFR